MNELTKQFAQLINDAVATGKDAMKFAVEQAPDVIQQIIRWKLCEAICISSICFIGLFFAIRWVRKSHKTIMDDGDGVAYTLIIPGLLLLSMPAVVFALRALQIALAPKVYLIEYAAKLLGR